MGVHHAGKTGRCEHGSVRRVDLSIYSSYHGDTNVKLIKINQNKLAVIGYLYIYFACAVSFNIWDKLVV